MINLKEVKTYTARYRDNEIFFLYSLNQFIIINKAYEGVLVFDHNLNLINTFILKDAEFLVEEVYKDYERNRIVFKLEEGVWFVDIINGDNKYIKLSDEDAQIYFPEPYQFDVDKIGTADKYYTIEWEFNSLYISKTLTLSPDKYVKLNHIKDTWCKHVGTRRYLNKDCIITYDAKSVIGLYSFENRHINTITIEDGDWYDFQLLNNYLLAVSEEKFAVLYMGDGSNTWHKIEAHPDEYFHRATLIDCNGDTMMAANRRNDFDGTATVILYSISDD